MSGTARPSPPRRQTIKGIEYAVFSATAGDYTATYAADTTAPVITDVTASPQPDGTATITLDHG